MIPLIPIIGPWLVRKLLSAKLGRTDQRATFLAQVIQIAVLVVLAIVAWQVFDAFNDHSAVKRHEAEREAVAAPAREKAAEERVDDALRNTRQEEQYHEAIDRAPDGGELPPAARALACERLRRIGRIPPACRPAGGDGSEAAPD